MVQSQTDPQLQVISMYLTGHHHHQVLRTLYVQNMLQPQVLWIDGSMQALWRELRRSHVNGNKQIFWGVKRIDTLHSYIATSFLGNQASFKWNIPFLGTKHNLNKAKKEQNVTLLNTKCNHINVVAIKMLYLSGPPHP